jgi:hypothetical protein
VGTLSVEHIDIVLKETMQNPYPPFLYLGDLDPLVLSFEADDVGFFPFCWEFDF